MAKNIRTVSDTNTRAASQRTVASRDQVRAVGKKIAERDAELLKRLAR